MKKPPPVHPCTRSADCGRESAFLVFAWHEKTSDRFSCVTHLGKVIASVGSDQIKVIKVSNRR